jgi:hypothetical protein
LKLTLVIPKIPPTRILIVTSCMGSVHLRHHSLGRTKARAMFVSDQRVKRAGMESRSLPPPTHTHKEQSNPQRIQGRRLLVLLSQCQRCIPSLGMELVKKTPIQLRRHSRTTGAKSERTLRHHPVMRKGTTTCHQELRPRASLDISSPALRRVSQCTPHTIRV